MTRFGTDGEGRHLIRALFVYRYCTMGGVETGMRFRVEHLSEHGVEAHALFLRRYGGESAFAGLTDRVFFGPNEAEFLDLVDTHRYDVISVIDTFEVLEWTDRLDAQTRVMVELRSTYEHTLVLLKKLAKHRLDAILVPSEFQARNVDPYLPRKIRKQVPRHVAPNFIDLEKFRFVPAAQAGGGPQIVCWLGRIDPLKNWDDFLKIADALCERENIEFWMVGGGGSLLEWREKFRKTVGKLRVAPRLRWWPALPNQRMPELYSTVAASGGVVALTTKCESFGFSALEAMACRCPVVAARVGALPELIEDGVSGLFYADGDVKSAAQLIESLLDDALRRDALARQAEAAVRERFDPGRCTARFAEVLHTIVRGRRSLSPA